MDRETDDAVPAPGHLELLAEVVRVVARQRRLPPDQADDFRQSVHMRLLERGYDVFRKFGGRSSLKTYLHVVVRRMLIDWRNASFGKWRPSAAARRLGPFAEALERLIYRDGHTMAEAIETVRQRPSAPPVPHLHAIARALPVRPWHRLVGIETVEQEPVAFDDPVEVAEARTQALRLRASLHDAIQGLETIDRRLLALRYAEGRSLRSVAAELQLGAKAVYRRHDRIRRRLWQALHPVRSDQASTRVGRL